MKILQVHNLYRLPGGEDVVAEQEASLLGEHHTVEQWMRDNTTELRPLYRRLLLPLTTHYSRASRKRMEKRLRRGGYDLMHVHNFFPLFTPSIFEAARDCGVPSVLTLHNYRLIHPNGLLFHDGEIDERSVKGSAWSCVRDGVYRDSLLQTAVVARMIEYHRRRGTWHRVPTLFIALTDFARRKLAEGGLPEERIRVKPNFSADPGDEIFLRRMQRLRASSMPGARHATEAVRSDPADAVVAAQKPPTGTGGTGGPGRIPEVGDTAENYFLFAGRVSREKGVRDLVETWLRHRPDATLRIAGDGPESRELQTMSKGHPGIRWLGRIDRENLLRQMEGATALLFPSRWYEGFPMTLVEAFSVGCPAIATDIGSQGEIVEEERSGLRVPVGDTLALAGAVQRLSDPALVQRLSEGARRQYLERYTPERNYSRLMEIYREAIELEKFRHSGDAT